MMRGGCFYGQIRYEATGTPFHESNCHCSLCRRTTGALFVTWFSVHRSTMDSLLDHRCRSPLGVDNPVVSRTRAATIS